MTLRPKEKKLLDVQEKKYFSAVFLQQKQLVSHSARSERPGRWQTTNPAPPHGLLQSSKAGPSPPFSFSLSPPPKYSPQGVITPVTHCHLCSQNSRCLRALGWRNAFSLTAKEPPCLLSSPCEPHTHLHSPHMIISTTCASRLPPPLCWANPTPQPVITSTWVGSTWLPII